jgi:hypothetical protein
MFAIANVLAESTVFCHLRDFFLQHKHNIVGSSIKSRFKFRSRQTSTNDATDVPKVSAMSYSLGMR